MVVPHLAFTSVLVKVVQIVLKRNRFLGEGFPQRQGRKLGCEKAEVFPEASETLFSNFVFSFCGVGNSWEWNASSTVVSSLAIPKRPWFAGSTVGR